MDKKEEKISKKENMEIKNLLNKIIAFRPKKRAMKKLLKDNESTKRCFSFRDGKE